MTAAKTQCERIIEILERDGQIDNFYAIHNRISLRLGARIFDLRKAGWQFEVEARPDKNTIYKAVRSPAPKQLSLV
jgi:Helix-turn-helix domain